MDKNRLKTLVAKAIGVSVLVGVVGCAATSAQKAKSVTATATYINAAEIEMVGKAERDKPADMIIKVVDLGYENFAVGLIHRGSTRNVPAGGEGEGDIKARSPEPCGRHVDTLPQGGTPGGLTHDLQTEGYYIVSGGGTLYTDGYIANGRRLDIAQNGWSCMGTAYGVKKVELKVGDVVIVPPGVVHGWADIPDHVEYLSFRPSQSALQAGWVNPIISNAKP